MAKSPVAILYDADGNPVSVVLDGSTYRLQMGAKVARASDGAFVNPATQESVSSIDGKTPALVSGRVPTDGSGVTQPISAASLPLPTGAAIEAGNLATIAGKDFATQTTLSALNTKVPADPAREGGNLSTLAGKDFATQTTLSALNTKVPADPAREGGNLLTLSNKDFATQTTLLAIKNTDGVKKITDALPVGDNIIGRTKVTDGTNVAGVDAQNAIYVGGKSATGVAPSSNPVAVSGVDGGGLKRSLLLDTAGRNQINVAQWLGSAAPTAGQKTKANSIPVTFASDQEALAVIISQATGVNLVTDYLKDGTAFNMKVNGTTPKVYTYNADPTKRIQLVELRVVFSASSIEWSGNGFGKDAAGILANGILVDMIVEGGTTIVLGTIKINEDFLRTFGAVPVISQAGATDVLVSSFLFSGTDLHLNAGTADKMRVTIRDNLTSGTLGVNYLSATFFGNKEV